MPETSIAHNEATTQETMREIAPVWHTAVLLLLLLALVGITLVGGRADHADATPHRLVGYTITFLSEWLMLGFIWLGARWQGATLRTLAGGFSPSWRSIAIDLGLAVAYLIVANLVLSGVSYLLAKLLHPEASAALKAMLPRTGLEVGLFLLLALTAGICEEMIFRGYLQRQFTAWTGNAAAGIALQAVAFGLAHAYQGLNQVLVIVVYGCMFGAFAWWRKSLRPGMMAHFIQDGVGGLLLARSLMK